MDKRKSGCGTYLIVWIAATVVVGAILAMVLKGINETGQSDQTILSTSMAIGYLATIILYVIRKASAGIKASMEKRIHQENGISRYQGILHVGGLDAPENCRAAFVLSPDTLMVTCGVREHILKIREIKSVEFRYDVNETKYMQSHLRLGLVGALMAGDSESIFGCEPTTKTKRDAIGYAIIFYEDSYGELHNFLLKDEAVNTFACAKLVDALKPRTPEQTRGGIEL